MYQAHSTQQNLHPWWDGIATLRKNSAFALFFGHLKSIGATGEAVAFMKDACQLPGVTFSRAMMLSTLTVLLLLLRPRLRRLPRKP